MRSLCIMFVTATCFLLLLKLKWPKNKNIYDLREPPCVWEGGYRRHQLSHEHYRQNFIGFNIWVDTETFSEQESALLNKKQRAVWILFSFSFTAG